ncbi:MotA/TolQ/ExbB proton channel family protein [Phycisphaerales bacterium]|nr:MotA/TolQ/ExbB proton channel family protein [Phycisphaerales bacterium]
MPDSPRIENSPDSVFLDLPGDTLTWSKIDPERRVGLLSGRDTSPHVFTTAIVAMLLMAIVYGLAFLLRGYLNSFVPPTIESTGSSDLASPLYGDLLWTLLTGYSRIPVAIFAIGSWAWSILLLKWLKIRAQRVALDFDVLPPEPEFRLTPDTVDPVIDHVESRIVDSGRFLFLDRVISVLRNVRNVGRVSDIDEMFASAADADEARMESSYTIIRGFIWAVPVLGFIGTILGLTEAISQFGIVLASGDGVTSTDTAELGKVIAGLDTAFVTTGEGLVVALLLQLAMAGVRRADEVLLDDIRKTCTRKVMSRVRIKADP